MHYYKELLIWEKSMLLVEKVYQLMKLMPDDEKFGLVSQIKRCAISIPSNIAEGAGRNSNKEFKHFLSIANGSTTELETQLFLIIRLELIKRENVNSLIDLCNEIRKMNFSLQKRIEKS